MEPVNANANSDLLGAINQPRAIRTEATGDVENNTLRESCKEFEGVLLGMILKDSLKTGMLDEDASGSSDSMRDFAIEQTARAIGESEAIGISKMLYKQMNR